MYIRYIPQCLAKHFRSFFGGNFELPWNWTQSSIYNPAQKYATHLSYSSCIQGVSSLETDNLEHFSSLQFKFNIFFSFVHFLSFISPVYLACLLFQKIGVIFIFIFWICFIDISALRRHSVQFLDPFLFPKILSFYSFPLVFVFGHVCSSTELSLWAFGAFCSKIVSVFSYCFPEKVFHSFIIYVFMYLSTYWCFKSITLRMGTGESGWLYHWLFLFSFRNILNFVFILYVLSLLFSSPNSAHILQLTTHPTPCHSSSLNKKEKHTHILTKEETFQKF